MNKFGGLLCLVGLLYFADAVSRKDVYRMIGQAGEQVREENIPLVKAVVKESLGNAASPEVTACVKGYISNTYKDLNLAIVTEQNRLRSELRTKTPAQLEAITDEQMAQITQKRLKDSVTWVAQRLEQIRQCSK